LPTTWPKDGRESFMQLVLLALLFVSQASAYLKLGLKGVPGEWLKSMMMEVLRARRDSNLSRLRASEPTGESLSEAEGQ